MCACTSINPGANSIPFASILCFAFMFGVNLPLIICAIFPLLTVNAPQYQLLPVPSRMRAFVIAISGMVCACRRIKQNNRITQLEIDFAGLIFCMRKVKEKLN